MAHGSIRELLGWRNGLALMAMGVTAAVASCGSDNQKRKSPEAPMVTSGGQPQAGEPELPEPETTAGGAGGAEALAVGGAGGAEVVAVGGASDAGAPSEGGAAGAPPAPPTCSVQPCEVNGVWSGVATITACESICSSPPGSQFNRTITLTHETATEFEGVYAENGSDWATVVGTRSGDLVRWDYEYIDTGSTGSCEGEAIGDTMTVDCAQYNGPEYGPDAGLRNSTYTEQLTRLPQE